MEAFNTVIRGLALVVGVVIVGLGVRYAVLTFDAIYAGIQDPARGADLFEQWALFLAGEMEGVPNNESLRRAEHMRIAAAFIVGVGGFMLAWLSAQMIWAGAKIIALMTTDYRGNRKMLSDLLELSRNESTSRAAQRGSSSKPRAKPKKPKGPDPVDLDTYSEQMRLAEIRRKAAAFKQD